MHTYRNEAADRAYAAMLTDMRLFPFSFSYNGETFCGIGEDFSLLEKKTERDGERETTTLLYRFRDSVQVRLLITHYYEYGATEWTVWFENTGTQDSGILSDWHSTLTFSGAHPTLNGILGDHVNFYRPYRADLTSKTLSFSSDSGRATHINFPYFNLEFGDGGALLAIGWAGTWRASFHAEGDTAVYRASSVNNLHTRLRPGECVRTALFVVLPYTRREEDYATNCWRSWFIRYNLPKFDENTPMHPFSTCGLAHDTGLPNSDGSISERHTTWRPSLEKMLSEGIHVDFRWFDAGWYIAPDGTSPESDWWGTVGTWVLDPVKWPGHTFRDSTDFARKHGMKTLMWFEPERISDPANMAKNYGYNPDWAIVREGCPVVTNNIGDPACLAWTTEQVCRTLRENRVEMYREDNNSDPASLWQYLDGREGADRLGITECKFIQGHYRMWDDIIACTLSYGGCGFVDSCASGGGRNDLESMRRGIPLLRSDHDRTSIAVRLTATTAFNKWIPVCGAGTQEKAGELDARGKYDTYIWRASYLPVLNISAQFVQDPTQDFEILRSGIREWNKVSPYLMKDFYVLTPWHTEFDNFDFTAIAYHDPETARGLVLAFRQENCVPSRLTVSLPFAETDASYRLTDEDSGTVRTLSGKALREGLDIDFASPRTARLLWVERI